MKAPSPNHWTAREFPPIVILIYIFLSTSEVEHHFTCFLAISISSSSVNSIYILFVVPPPTPRPSIELFFFSVFRRFCILGYKSFVVSIADTTIPLATVSMICFSFV